MPSSAATTRCRLAVATLAAVGAACAGGAPKFDPGRLDAERVAKVRACEVAYRAESPEYPALRDALLSDPVAVHWLVRTFVRDLILVREGRPLGETEELFKAAAGIEDPVERRAIAEIELLGAKAAKTVIGDLLQHSQPQPRELGLELIARIGAPALPDLLPLTRSGQPRERRVAARALGNIGGPQGSDLVLAELERLARDSEFTVRADAMRGLARGPAAWAAGLRAALRDDADPFVRRVAAQGLANHPSKENAAALIDYLARCDRESDNEGGRAAQSSLQAVSGMRGMRVVSAWRTWFAGNYR